MIWLAWRQFRAQALLAVAATAAISIALALSRSHIVDTYSTSGNGELTGIYVWIRLLGTVLIAVPAAIGAFWGAPLVASEIEGHTQRLAWTQSVTRRRWLVTKVVLIAAVSIVTVGVFTASFTSWAAPIDAVGNRIGTANFGQRGIVPISYALFAFALGSLLGILIRRTLPALAATVVAFMAVRIAFQQVVRARLVRSVEMSTPTFDSGSIGGWILSTHTVDATGATITGFENQITATCGITRQTLDYERAIAECARSLGIRDITRLHPASHFWKLQIIESGIFAAVAAALLAACCYFLQERPT